MNIKPRIQDVLWMAAGAGLLLVVVLVVLHLQQGQDPAAQIASKALRVELVGRIRLDLARASEAEKSSVLAVTDEESQRFADEARTAAAEVEQRRVELARLLADSGDQGEKDLLAQFTAAVADLQRIDKDLLALAVRNSNIKASSLAFGPAAAAIREMDSYLSRLPVDDVRVVRVADAARIAAWRLLSLIPPHIAEESDQKMDQMEADMDKEDTHVRQSLDELGASPVLASNPDLKAAVARYAQFSRTRVEILKLSRENTNVRSLSISLNQKRKVMLVCQATLDALQQAIQAEPIAGVDYGNVRPR